jgi:AAA15 family ATPase/GTPase
MIDDIAIENFKCFNHLEIKNLKRFNIIVGGNAGGKTALLEAIFLAAAGTPGIVFNLRRFRGLSELEVRDDRASYEGLWRDLFHNISQDVRISIELTSKTQGTRSLSIAYKPSRAETLPFGERDLKTEEIRGVGFQWTSAEGQSWEIEPALTPKGITIANQDKADVVPTYMVTPVFQEPATENARRFSELSKQRRADRLVNAIRDEFPFVEDISIEYESGKAMLHASLRGLDHKIPLIFVSDGVNKLCSMLIGLEFFAGGIVLLDEMENGFYHEAQRSISKVVFSLARSCDVQLFLTTHSLEYLRSLSPLVEADPEDFCLLRASRANGECLVEQFQGRHLVAALLEGFEVR